MELNFESSQQTTPACENVTHKFILVVGVAILSVKNVDSICGFWGVFPLKDKKFHEYFKKTENYFELTGCELKTPAWKMYALLNRFSKELLNFCHIKSKVS